MLVDVCFVSFCSNANILSKKPIIQNHYMASEDQSCPPNKRQKRHSMYPVDNSKYTLLPDARSCGSCLPFFEFTADFPVRMPAKVPRLEQPERERRLQRKATLSFTTRSCSPVATFSTSRAKTELHQVAPPAPQS